VALWVGLILAKTPACGAQSQPKPSAPPSGSPSDTSSALEFLGSYTAPSAVLATETSHTSAHPPAPAAARRLRRIEVGLDTLAPWAWDFTWSADSLAATCGLVSQGSRRDASLADADLRAQHFAEALADYDRVAAAHAGCTAAAWNRAVGAAYAHSPAATSTLTNALADAPSTALGSLFMGLAQLSAGDTPGARLRIVPALDASATTRSATNATLDASRLSSDSEGPSEGVKDRDLIWARAMLAQASGEPAQARQDLERLSTMESDSPKVWFALGGAALEEARADSRRLSEIAPASEWNRRLQAEGVTARYPALGQTLWPGAVPGATENPGGTVAPNSDLKAADSPESLYQQAHAALHLCQDAYQHASQSPRFSAYLHALKALAAEQEGDEPAAIREYQEGLAQNPASAILHAGLGHCYRQRLDLEAAEPELRRAWELDPSDPLIAFELGDVCQRLGQPQEALQSLNQALGLDPEFLLARWSRGKTYLALGDTERALADLEAAAPADNTGDLQFQLARIYLKLGRSDLAAQAQKRSEEQRRTVDGRQ